MSKKQHVITIPDTHVNERLDQTLAKLLPEYSRTQLKTWIENHDILVNEQPAKTKYKIKGGEMVTITAHDKPTPIWQAQAIPLNIVHEDEALIIINKPVGLVVHPGAGNPDSTLLNALLHHAPELSALPRAGILHRIDKDTSGLLIIAKTKEALKKLSHQLKQKTLVREYQAIVYGKLISGGKVDQPIERHPLYRKRMAVVDTGKHAVTHFRVMEKYRSHTRLRVQLETGRTHQIRVHLSHLRHPIVGDITYGGRVQLTKGMTPELIEAIRGFKRQALHAFALEFQHPNTDNLVRYEIDLPDDMQQLIQALKNDAR